VRIVHRLRGEGWRDAGAENSIGGVGRGRGQDCLYDVEGITKTLTAHASATETAVTTTTRDPTLCRGPEAFKSVVSSSLAVSSFDGNLHTTAGLMTLARESLNGVVCWNSAVNSAVNSV
jgi:hypothetical protein